MNSACTHKFKWWLFTEAPVLSRGLKNSDVLIKITLRFGLTNIIDKYLKAKNHPHTTLIVFKIISYPGVYNIESCDGNGGCNEAGFIIYYIIVGTGVYNIESCDGNGGCNVAAFVSNDFFAQQESKDDAVRFGGK